MTRKTAQNPQGHHRSSSGAVMAWRDYPALAQHADRISQKGQALYLRLIRIELCAAIIAAALSDLIHDLSAIYLRLVGLALIFFLVAALLVQIRRLFKRHDQRWFEGRAVAESTKTLTWRYMMKVPPFQHETLTTQEFAGRLQTVVHSCLVCQAKVPGDGQEVTDRMREVRSLNWEKRRDFYIAARLNDQVDWYLSKAKYNSARSKLWLHVSVAAQIAAIVAAWYALHSNGRWNFVPLLTTVAASCVAWAQAKNFDEMRESYRLAHEELCQIKSEHIITAASEGAFLDAVVNSEGAISREHTMWAARSGSPVAWKIA